MKRRQFIQTAGASTLGMIAGFSLFHTSRPLLAQTAPVTIEWFGHTCFLISGGGSTILVNPYKSIGCTAGYKTANPSADLVLISSQLFDEGFVDDLAGNPQVLWQSGQYPINGMTFNGFSLDHSNVERYRGWRFPPNIAWSWNQGGLNLLHLGGAGELVDVDDFILTGGIPDVVMIPVGGTNNAAEDFPPKGYTPQQAIEVLKLLKPKIIIPTHYQTAAADEMCRLSPVDEFLDLVDQSTTTVTSLSSNRFTLNAANLSADNSEIKVLNSSSLLKA